MSNKEKIETRVIHAGQTPDPSTGAVMPPIYATSTFAQKSPGKHQGYEYSRTKNPTRLVFENCIADLESGKKGFAFASGMAAIATVLELLDTGDHVIVMDDVYGGTYRLFNSVRQRSAGLKFTSADFTDLNHLTKQLQANTKMIWLETPSNPLLKIVDLTKIINFAKQNHLLSVVDNTFATPIIQRPIEYGADVVIHSVTKYLGGHSDIIGGATIVGDNTELQEKIAYLQNAVGAIMDPFTSFLALRGIKTLALRVQRHCDNALELARWLKKQKKVTHVIFPGLNNHPQYKLAKQQMKYFGGMISVILDCDLSQTVAILERCRIFTLAESLGGVESLIEHPATMTHAALPKNLREQLGIYDNLIRISVGVEAIDDLIGDLKEALS